MVELKHCPFCGGKAARSHGGEGAKTYFGTGCADQGCPAHLFALVHRTQADADAVWNRRASREAAVVGVLRENRELRALLADIYERACRNEIVVTINLGGGVYSLWDRIKRASEGVRGNDQLRARRPVSRLLDKDAFGVHVVQFDSDAQEVIALRTELARIAHPSGAKGERT